MEIQKKIPRMQIQCLLKKLILIHLVIKLMNLIYTLAKKYLLEPDNNLKYFQKNLKRLLKLELEQKQKQKKKIYTKNLFS